MRDPRLVEKRSLPWTRPPPFPSVRISLCPFEIGFESLIRTWLFWASAKVSTKKNVISYKILVFIGTTIVATVTPSTVLLVPVLFFFWWVSIFFPTPVGEGFRLRFHYRINDRQETCRLPTRSERCQAPPPYFGRCGGGGGGVLLAL